MIFGAVIGDVVGSPYEFHNIKRKDFPLINGYSKFTDDSVLTLAVANALMKFKKGEAVDESKFQQAVKDSMLEFGRRYRTSYGSHFKAWLNSANPQPYNSFGNGSAMRVSPVAWYFDDLPTVERFAEITALPTHNHPEGIKGAQATAAAIFLARTNHSKDEIRSYISLRYGYDLKRTCDDIRPDYDFEVSCQGTVPEAIIAFLDGENFEDSLRNAISLGGDSDTLAAITCSIAEGFYGVPAEIESLVRPLLDDFMTSELDRWSRITGNESKPDGRVKNGVTDMVFILDRSGSMSGLESDTIGGFNSMINKQKKESGTAIVSTILFDDVQEILHDRVRLADVKPMTSKEYFTRGMTALLDAVGGAINHTVRVYRHSRPEDVPEKTIFVIITDGFENASRKYSYSEVKRMIEHETEKYGWEFLFIGANIDAVEAASSIGISADRAVDYVADSQGTEVVYESVGKVMCCMSMCEEPREVLRKGEWRKKMDADYSARSHRKQTQPDISSDIEIPDISSDIEIIEESDDLLSIFEDPAKDK